MTIIRKIVLCCLLVEFAHRCYTSNLGNGVELRVNYNTLKLLPPQKFSKLINQRMVEAVLNFKQDE